MCGTLNTYESYLSVCLSFSPDACCHVNRHFFQTLTLSSPPSFVWHWKHLWSLPLKQSDCPEMRFYQYTPNVSKRIVTTVRDGRPRNGGLILVRGKTKPRWVPGSFSLWTKWPLLVVAHSPPSCDQIKNSWRYVSIPVYTFMIWCLIKHRTACILRKVGEEDVDDTKDRRTYSESSFGAWTF